MPEPSAAQTHGPGIGCTCEWDEDGNPVGGHKPPCRMASAAQGRCEYVLPQVGVLRELGQRRCALDEGHAGEHLFDFPKITPASGEQLELDPQPKLSTCRSCRRSIIWTRTERGKKMPLDADPVTNHDQGGLFVLREMERKDGPLAIAAWGLAGTEPHYVSHFSSCPDADLHRTGGRRFGKTEELRQAESRAAKATKSEDKDQPPQDPGWRPAGRKYRSSAR